MINFGKKISIKVYDEFKIPIIDEKIERNKIKSVFDKLEEKLK